jgi:hypothetical protein
VFYAEKIAEPEFSHAPPGWKVDFFSGVYGVGKSDSMSGVRF